MIFQFDSGLNLLVVHPHILATVTTPSAMAMDFTEDRSAISLLEWPLEHFDWEVGDVFVLSSANKGPNHARPSHRAISATDPRALDNGKKGNIPLNIVRSLLHRSAVAWLNSWPRNACHRRGGKLELMKLQRQHSGSESFQPHQGLYLFFEVYNDEDTAVRSSRICVKFNVK